MKEVHPFGKPQSNSWAACWQGMTGFRNPGFRPDPGGRRDQIRMKTFLRQSQRQHNQMQRRATVPSSMGA